MKEIYVSKVANCSLYFQRFLGCTVKVDKEVSLMGCLGSKAEEIHYLKSIGPVLDSTKDLGHPAFVEIKIVLSC